MKKMIEKGIKSRSKNPVMLMILPKENFHELNMHALKTLLSEGLCGAYISLNRPHENILSIMNDKKINAEKLFFIDCVSEKKIDKENCTFIGSAKSLTNIAVALDPIYKSEKHEFIFLDSLDALSNYHKPEMIVRFGRDLINKIRQNSMCGIMIGLHEDTDKKIINELSIVCDKVIWLNKE